MAIQKNCFTLVLIIVLLCSIPTSVEARSVYAIPKYDWGERLNVYDVLEGMQEGQLDYRATCNLSFDGAAECYFGLF